MFSRISAHCQSPSLIWFGETILDSAMAIVSGLFDTTADVSFLMQRRGSKQKLVEAGVLAEHLVQPLERAAAAQCAVVVLESVRRTGGIPAQPQGLKAPLRGHSSGGGWRCGEAEHPSRT